MYPLKCDEKMPEWIAYSYWIIGIVLCIFCYKSYNAALMMFTGFYIGFGLGLAGAYDRLQEVYRNGDVDDQTTYDLIWNIFVKKKKLIE